MTEDLKPPKRGLCVGAPAREPLVVTLRINKKKFNFESLT